MSLVAVPYIPVEKSIYVDSTNGSSGGARGRLDRPFATIAQANAVATIGDCVRIVAGTYNEKNIAKNGVDYEIGPNVIIDYTSGSNGSLIDDTSDGINASLVTNIVCHGIMRNRGGASGRNNIVCCSRDGTDFNASTVSGGSPTIITRAAGWSGAAVGDLVIWDTAGVSDYRIVTNISGASLTVSGGDMAAGSNKVTRVGGSKITLYCRNAEIVNNGTGGENSIVRQDGGYCDTEFLEARARTSVFWWSNGTGFVKCRYAKETGGGTIIYAFSGDAGGTLIGTWRSGEWFVDLDFGQCAGQAIRCALGAPEARTWIFFKELAAPYVALSNEFAGTINISSGKNYLIGEKVSNNGTASQNLNCVAIDGGENHIDIQKIANARGPSVLLAGGENYLKVNRIEDSASDAEFNLGALEMAGGLGTVVVDDLICTAQPASTAQPGITLDGGTMCITANVRAITGFPAVLARASGPVLKNCTIKAAVGQNSIYADGATNVNLEGVNEVDKDKHANVTCKGSGSLVKNVAGTATVIYSPFV